MDYELYLFIRIKRLIAPLTAAAVAVLTLGQAANADLLIRIDKSARHDCHRQWQSALRLAGIDRRSRRRYAERRL